MKRLLFIFVPFWFVFVVKGQNINDFNQFRNQIMSDYQGFRKKVFDEYATYLEGIWREYDTFRGVERNKVPKPDVVPFVDKEPQPQPKDNPEPEMPKGLDGDTNPYVDIDIPSDHKTLSVSFYDYVIRLPECNIHEIKGISEKAVANAWKDYVKQEAVDVSETVKVVAENYGLNDWLVFELVRQYTQQLNKKSSSASKVALQHFLLSNLGYDVRIARTDQHLLLLVPFEQQVYARSYIQIDGKNYYLFKDEQENWGNESIYTCDIPRDIDCGLDLNLRIENGLNLPAGNAMTQRVLTDGVLTLSGEVNTNIMEMVRRYPQTDIPEYAKSSLCIVLRNNLIDQLNSQLMGLNEKQAVARILHFVQFAFDYATDNQQHGYEKPYFVEENFYYPKNDCEDRAIFFAFLIRNTLGLDIHLIEYPGHECAAIHFTDETVVGDGYNYQGKRYVICDPTYIGASIGECMDQYKNTSPKVELW